MPEQGLIRVLIVDDMPSFRERFEEILGADERIRIAGLAASGREAVELALRQQPHVILMDVVMETKTAGIDATRLISEQLPETKIIFITVLEDEKTILNAFQTGVVDYLGKNAPPDEVIGAVHAAFEDRSPIRPLVAEKIRREFRKIRKQEENLLFVLNIVRKLTPVELDILLLLCDNNNRSEIARMRCIELCTIKTHISNLLKKFNQVNTHDLVTMLKQMQIIELLKRTATGS